MSNPIRPYYDAEKANQHHTERQIEEKKNLLERFLDLFGGAELTEVDNWENSTRAKYAQSSRGGEIIDQK